MTKAPENKQKCDTLKEINTVLTNKISEGLAIVKDGKVIFSNEALQNLLGTEITGMNISSIISDAIHFNQKYLPTASNDGFELVSLTTVNGPPLLVECTKDSILYEGEAAEIYLFRDLTPQFEIAQAAEKCELRYTEILTKSPISFFTISPRGIIQDINNAAAKLLGYRKDQLLKRSATILFPRDTRGKRAGSDLISTVLNGKNITDVEVQFSKADGTTTWVSVTSYPIFVEGRMDSVMLMAIDINRRRMAELRAAMERNRSNLYLEVMTHDLNNINQELVFAIGLLTESLEIPDTIQDLLDQTMWNIRRSARMIRNMRSLLKLQTDPPSSEPMNVQKPFTHAIEMVKEDLSWKKIRVNYDPDALNFTITCNSFIEDVFFNVLHNAALFNPSENVTIDVTIETDYLHNRARISIEDYGLGIPDSLKEAVFRRTEEQARKKAGRGLGLTLINEIMKSINGKVSIHDHIVDDKIVGTRVDLEFELWSEKVALPCGRKTCITFYKSEHCLFCEPSKEVLLQAMQAVGVAMRHLEIVDVDTPSMEAPNIDISMLPVVKICDIELHGFFESDMVQGALLNLMLKPCFPDT